MRARRPCVLLFAADLELVVHVVGALPHVLFEKRRPQAVVDHGVHHLRVAHARPEPRFRDEVRRLRHGLHPAGDDDLDLAGTNELIGQRDRVQARQAHLIDGDGRDLLRDAGLDRRLARSDLTGSSLQNLAHDHVIHVAGLHTAALEGRPDRMAAQRDRRHIFESSAKLAEWRARARYDHG